MNRCRGKRCAQGCGALLRRPAPPEQVDAYKGALEKAGINFHIIIYDLHAECRIRGYTARVQ
jgi:hypothetical protein